MSKAKPFLFGTALGASAMFVALQYHVIHSHDGFQIIPRTPQQAVGLAFADIRSWSPSQWTDRPELARALMAHGSSDLISESVAGVLADSVSEDSSTLEELRSFLNKTDLERHSGDASEHEDLPASGSSDKPGDRPAASDIFRIPFPQDAKNDGPADPFRVARKAGTNEEPRPASGSRFSTAELLEGLNGNRAARATEQTLSEQKSAGSVKNAGSVAAQAQEMEDRIFGGRTVSGGPAAGGSGEKSAPKSDATESMFDEVSTQLENRAQEALNRANQVVSDKARSVSGEVIPQADGFIRSKANAETQGVSKPTVNGAAAESTLPTPSLLKDFDPFLE